MLLLLLLLAGAGAFLYAQLAADPAAIANAQNQRTARSLAEVREALIGWSVARNPLDGTGASDNDRPGELPCPDTGNNSNPGDADGNCVAGRLGRVPWRTLGIPEPRDGSGETLWYTLAGPFRRSPTPASNPINSDTKGNITVYGASGAVTLTTEAVAVVFAPGPALASQQRDTQSALCITTAITLPRWRCAANYLESSGSINNATTNGPFIAGNPGPTFNDRLLVITTADLMPAVEKRVARDLMILLGRYRSATASLGYSSPSGPGVLPYATSGGSGNSFLGRNRGRLPGPDPYSPSGVAFPVNWGVSGAPNLPVWFNDNLWRRVIYYAVARDLTDSTHGCTSCMLSRLSIRTSCASATGETLAGALLITPGAAASGRPQSYPFGYWWPVYLDDPCNSDDVDDTFVWPSSTARVRDQLFYMP